MVRHGKARKLQQINQKGRVTGFKKQGIHKKFANLSPNRLRAMFPDLGHFSDDELIKRAIKRLEERG